MSASDSPLVYLVDDDPTWLRALGRSLRREGLTIETFLAPRDALDRFEHVLPELVVIDFDLGLGGTGAELATRLREDLRSSCPDLVLVTGTLHDVSDDQLVLFDQAFAKSTPSETLVGGLVARARAGVGSRSGHRRKADAPASSSSNGSTG